MKRARLSATALQVPVAFTVAITTSACSPGAMPSTVPSPQAPCAAAVRLAYVQDKSKSANGDVYQLSPEELRGPAELLIRCGGELGVGTVGEHAGEPLARWDVEMPKAPPTVPNEDQTPITLALEEDQYQADLAAWQAEEDTRVSKARDSFETFFERVAPMLGENADQAVTPLWTALVRADSFLAEPDAVRTRSHRYMVLSSDGRNNVGRPEPLTSGAKLFIANGPRAVNALNGLTFTVVENPVSAFRLIIDLESPDADEQAR